MLVGQIASAGAAASADELTTCRRQVRELTQSVDQYKAQVDTLKTINDDLTRRNLGLESTNGGLQGAHEAMGKERLERQRQLHEMESQLKSLEAGKAAKEKEVASLKATLQALNTQIQEMHAGYSEDKMGRQRRDRDLASNFRSLVEDKNLAIDTGERMAGELRMMERGHAQLQQEFAAQASELHRVRQQLAAVQARTHMAEQASSNPGVMTVGAPAAAPAAPRSPTPASRAAGGRGGKEEEALTMTRRLLDLERGTGKMLRERNVDLEARSRRLQTQIDEMTQQLSVLKRDLVQKNQDMHELQLITAAWMGAGAARGANGGDAGSRAMVVNGVPGVAAAGKPQSGGASSELAQRVFQGCDAGVSPACVTLFFSKELVGAHKAAAPPAYKDMMLTPYNKSAGSGSDGVGGVELVCQALAAQLGVGSEALALVSCQEVYSEEGKKVTSVGVLVLASNHLLQAQGIYQVADAETPAGIAQRLAQTASSGALVFWDDKVKKELGLLQRVEMGVMQSGDAVGMVPGEVPGELDASVSAKMQEMKHLISQMEQEREAREGEMAQLRQTATELSRHIDDAAGSETTLNIPRDKLEEVLRDAQYRIDEAEARCEQLAVQLLLYQHRPDSTEFVADERRSVEGSAPLEQDEKAARHLQSMRMIADDLMQGGKSAEEEYPFEGDDGYEERGTDGLDDHHDRDQRSHVSDERVILPSHLPGEQRERADEVYAGPEADLMNDQNDGQQFQSGYSSRGYEAKKRRTGRDEQAREDEETADLRAPSPPSSSSLQRALANHHPAGRTANQPRESAINTCFAQLSKQPCKRACSS